MAYGQITTSSGRTLTLTPDGWVNGAGEQLTPPSGAYGMTLSDMLTNRGMNASNPVDVVGKGRGYMDSNGVIRGVDAGGQEWSATPGIDMDKTRELQKFNADLEGKRLNNQLTLAQIAAAGRKEAPTYQHVETPNGLMVFNPRTGELAQPAGMPIPTKEQAQQSKDATSVMELTDAASPLLRQAPGSYLGAAGNQLSRVVGMDTDASRAQAQLDVLSGALISKMPKMSGPQSDKDVLLYKQMAGNLNDPTLPASAKEAAITTLRALNRKYATGYQGQADAMPAADTSKPSQGIRVGTVDDGHVYLGGDPANPASWKKVK